MAQILTETSRSAQPLKKDPYNRKPVVCLRPFPRLSRYPFGCSRLNYTYKKQIRRTHCALHAHVSELHPSAQDLIDHTSLDHPSSRSFLLLVPVARFSPVAIARALLHAANDSSSSLTRLDSTNNAKTSLSRSVMNVANSMHSSSQSREREVPATCSALT